MNGDVERNSRLYRRLCGALSASPDDFIRTTEPRHRLGVHEFWRRLRPSDVYKAIGALWSVVTRVNQEIERTRPWDLLKTPGGGAVRTHLQSWLTEVHRVGHWLSPFLPDAGRRVLEALSPDRIAACRPLFPRRNPPAEMDGRE